MKIFNHVFVLLPLICILPILQPIPSSAELIEPTRSLRDGSDGSGYLSVFSEPPEQVVRLDGEMIGSTPIVRFKVTTGLHELKIGDTETEIYIASDKSVRLSLFEGELLVLPEKREKPPEKPKVATEDRPEPPDPEVTPDKIRDMRYDPNYWPQNPKGPIYPEKMAE
jgi:hypothetical protein